jgi:hypothetical protein
LHFPTQQQHTLSGHTALPLPKPAKECRCPSPVMNDEV